MNRLMRLAGDHRWEKGWRRPYKLLRPLSMQILIASLLLMWIPSGIHGILGVAAESGPPSVHPLVQSRDFEREVVQFFDRYRQFLECCATHFEALDQLAALEAESSTLLAQARTGLFAELKKLRSFTIQELATRVEQARDDLYMIRTKLEQLREAEDKLAMQRLDFFTFWTEHRKIREALEAIPSEIRPPTWHTGHPTGMDIGVTQPTGPEAGTVPPTGSAIGTVPATGHGIGTTPPTGREIGTTPPTGQEIGTTPPTGSAIGRSPSW